MAEWILGVGASHNGAAALLRDGQLFVAIQEERLTRVKRARLRPAFDSLAIRYCLDAASIGPENLALIGICRDEPLALPESDITRNPLLARVDPSILVHTSHHRAHAAAASYQSGFDDAAVLVIDGLGSPLEDLDPRERQLAGRDGWETLSIYRLQGGQQLTPLRKDVAKDKAWLSHSASGMPRFGGVGGMYSSASHQIFGAYLDAGKVMGLAPHGKPAHAPSDFWRSVGGKMEFSDVVPAQYRSEERWPANERGYAALAASVQSALEEAVLWAVREAQALTGAPRLVYAGGVALNCIANERILRETTLEDVFVMPAAEDSGTAIGAAVCAAWQRGGLLCRRRLLRDSTGRSYSRLEIDRALATFAVRHGREDRGDGSARRIAGLIADGAFVGLFTGGSELGPRALGFRSILGDPRSPTARDELNRRKGRELFRPVAPAVLVEHAREWFDMGPCGESPFMLRIAAVRAGRRQLVPSVVHVDGSARVQTIDCKQASQLRAILEAFHELTGVPILINTSFNATGEPIVETPEDALWCASSLGLDALAFDHTLVRFNDTQPAKVRVTHAPHRIRRELGDPTVSALEVEVETPWGPTNYTLRGAELEAFQLVKPGKDIAELSGSSRMLQSLERLRRKRLIQLTTPPDGSPSLAAGAMGLGGDRRGNVPTAPSERSTP